MTQLTDLEREIDALMDDIDDLETEKAELKHFLKRGQVLRKNE